MLQGDLEILGDAERLEYARHLEFDADAAPDSIVRLEPGDIVPVVEDLSARRRILAEDEAEERALAGAVRADEAVEFARL